MEHIILSIDGIAVVETFFVMIVYMIYSISISIVFILQYYIISIIVIL